MERRDFVKALSAGAAGGTLFRGLAFARSDPWKTEYTAILARIKAPTFPKKDFSILKFGAKAGGAVDCREAINKAIEACSKAGEGVIPEQCQISCTKCPSIEVYHRSYILANFSDRLSHGRQECVYSLAKM